MNLQSHVTQQQIVWSRRAHWNPIANLDPLTLSRHLDQFHIGRMRGAALVWNAMERRDPMLATVAPKRKKAVSRLPWEVIAIDESAGAVAQKEVLETFWRSIEVTDALEQNFRGGLGLLVRQMADSIGKRYAVHEIVWKPSSNGLSAEFRFVPLWFFESILGRLRFLTAEWNLYGIDMPKGEWMVTCGDGLMEPCSVAYMYKHLPLKDWLAFSEKFGSPGVIGKTDSAQDSPEWKALEEAVASVSQDMAGVISRSSEITLLELSNQGSQPFEAIIDKMDRYMACLWRGGDLSTISQADSVGALLQGDENSILVEDDAQSISETLNTQVERYVLDYAFGPGTPAMAYIKLIAPQPRNTELDLKVDAFLIGAGVKLSAADACERYSRAAADADDEVLLAPAQPQNPVTMAPLDNEEDPGSYMSEEFLKAIASDLQPLRQRLERIMQIEDSELQAQKLQDLKKDMAGLLHDINADPAAAQALERAMAEQLIKGATK